MRLARRIPFAEIFPDLRGFAFGGPDGTPLALAAVRGGGAALLARLPGRSKTRSLTVSSSAPSPFPDARQATGSEGLAGMSRAPIFPIALRPYGALQMAFHQGPYSLKTELAYGSHLLRVSLQDPIMLLVEAMGRILQRVFQGDALKIAPEQQILTLCPRCTDAERLNALLAAERTDLLEPFHA